MHEKGHRTKALGFDDSIQNSYACVNDCVLGTTLLLHRFTVVVAMVISLRCVAFTSVARMS